MISLYLTNAIVSLNWDLLYCNIYGFCMLLKLLGRKVLAGVSYYDIWGTLVYINLTDSECLLGSLCTHIS